MTIKRNKTEFFDILKIGNKNFKIHMHFSGIQTDMKRYGSQMNIHQNKD